MALQAELRDRLSILLDLPPESIADTTLFSDIGVDSMMRLELVAMVEQHVGYELPEQDLEQLRTLTSIGTYVDARRDCA
ncbi:MAG: acyl carrier protein [Acidobacteriota bacterium]